MKKVRWEDLFGITDRAVKEVIKKHSYALKEDIQAAWPVKTGKSKAGWRVYGHRYGWTVSNNVVSPEGHDYVPNLWLGMPIGSPQLPNGGDPIVQRRRVLLEKDLKRIKL